MKPSTLPDGHGSLYKEVRFSPTQSPSRRTKSVSATFPPTITGYGRTAFHDSALLNSFAMDTSYIDQSRALLQNQRVNFEAERTLFTQERKLWEKERTLLRTKIAELEGLLKDQGKRNNKLGPEAAKLVLGASQLNNTNGFTAQVWEGSSPNSQPTRVFVDYESPNQAHMSPISESGMNPPSLDRALSHQGQLADPSGAPVSLPVPIEKLDSTLDGITLKSTALPPGVVARVITPPSPSPLETKVSPSAPGEAARPGIEHRNSLKLKLSELGPPNERLLRNAGHTPMAIIDADESQRSTKEASPLEVPSQSEENPLAPVATNVQPSENRVSYFPELPDLPDDPALKGPLGLVNDEEHDNDFLSALDQKLLDQAKNILGSSVESADPNESDPEPEFPSQGDKEPAIKFRKSTNFGSAFGISNLS
ncbi:unnamed protein product [Penicillium salamii]|uniref:Uncharacterized protein n=1 Tax=Penicillium salamii TaxID=1612424 RepID=A0A9W4JK96_9EURO|nr:unnamed protein product [Penicillium salamii]CAG8049363.1 unnamed protein product [Penicillium salamii]CAG8149422.1 unnamed protein product [Penicillium salamii]CAG8208520.1 unnamed protein product [Penicillium salamii]CAG8319725.1 unnamed protein product [Penicillium salamii]